MIPGATGDAKAISLIESLLRSRGAIAPELIDARTIESLVRARCAAGVAASVDAYARALQADASEMDRLIAEIAVPETWFFRYLSSYELLRTLLSAHAADPSRTARILSVGCAAGCEPVSIAIAALSAGLAPEQVEVIALDRNPQAVRDAQEGRWPAHSLREGLPAWAAPWIGATTGDARTDGGAPAHVDPRALRCIRWRTGDATVGPLAEPGSCIAVFCRNVLIYLDANARETLLSRLTDAVSADGLLFLGHAESMVGRAGLESAGVPGAFAWRRMRTDTRAPAERSSRPNAPVAQPTRARPPRTAIEPAVRRPAPPASRDAAGPASAAGRDAPMRRPVPSATVARATEGAAHAAIADAQGALARGDIAAAREGLLDLAHAISKGEEASRADETELAAGLLSSVGELDAAFDLYSRIAYVNPAHDRALLAMAELAESLGRTDEAERLRERLRRLAARQAGEGRT